MLTFISQTLIIAFFALFCFKLNGQTHFGLRGGTNFANASKGIKEIGGGGLTSKRMIGINIGTYFEFELNKALSLQPELSFLQKGFNRDLNKTYTYRFNYIDIAILLKINHSELIPDKKRKRNQVFYGAFGPYVGYAVSVTSEGKKQNDSNNYKGDLGLLTSIGIKLPITDKSSFVFDLRYIHGLARTVNKYVGWGDLRNRGILPSFGFAWKF